MNRFRTTTLTLVAALAGGWAHAASVDAQIQSKSGGLPLHHYPVEILAVDTKLQVSGSSYIKPGTHMIVFRSLRPNTAITRAQQQVMFTAEPCKRYLVAANHGQALEENWTLVVLATEDRAGCDASQYTPPPPPTPQRFFGFDQELSMLGDRAAVRIIGQRCGELVGDPARGTAAVARWEQYNGASVDAVERRVQYFVISRGSIGGYERAVQLLQLFEQGIAERRDAVTAESLGEGDLVARCGVALAALEKRVEVYTRSKAALKAVKDARDYDKKYGEDSLPLVQKNWSNLVEDAAVEGGYWAKPASAG